MTGVVVLLGRPDAHRLSVREVESWTFGGKWYGHPDVWCSVHQDCVLGAGHQGACEDAEGDL